MKSFTIKITTMLLLTSLSASVSLAANDDFSSVVKMIEQFYNVKHEGIPFLARAGMKAVGLGAKIKGGEAKYLAEAGSIKLAMFEDQSFAGDMMKFRSSLNGALQQTWTALVQTISGGDNEQSYVFVREKDNKFNVLVISISQRDATVVQATLSPKNLALLMKNPEEGAKSITQEARINDNE
jgi:hypothetical protein